MILPCEWKFEPYTVFLMAGLRKGRIIWLYVRYSVSEDVSGTWADDGGYQP